MSYGGDPFRGREHLKENPDYRIISDNATIILDHAWLDLGLHQVRVFHFDGATRQKIAESAVFFEIRLPHPEKSAAATTSSCTLSPSELAYHLEERSWGPPKYPISSSAAWLVIYDVSYLVSCNPVFVAPGGVSIAAASLDDAARAGTGAAQAAGHGSGGRGPGEPAGEPCVGAAGGDAVA
eukprot:CAMPEP_0113672128 /NCGR_PEP_ID=MMETSP0038_2-20120614/6087_1 /TAXON_ID=2898 /ORGANISM="Cryptomonas paramecium" /LENGTH=180 /DNA_ID=CAMNT_0000588355 /DNA_START=214 /DNA_END=753 /DNA_ORIENTATION=+ /assembly_acc=CAM_ASM_000170